MNARALLPIVGIAAVAAAVWPTFISRGVAEVRAESTSTQAPVNRDYEQRDKLVAFWEGAVRERHTSDMLSPRELAGQYLQRYREQGNIDDVIRAKHMAEQSLRIMPRNIAALDEMAAVMITLHRFREALHDVDELVPYDPSGAVFLAQEANIEMELGKYAAADAALRHIGADERESVASETARSRYNELTGRLGTARTLLDDAMMQADAAVDEPAQARAWYHFRAGELAFEAGDNAAAIRDEQDAIAIFPTYNLALKDLAKFELANHRYREALDAAVAGAHVTPFAETLGYEADAEAALGNTRDAATSREVIFAIERIGNAYRVNDRLLAIYYADHRLRTEDALTIARREVAVRGDEIYAQDTLAWAAAMDNNWDLAFHAEKAATRSHTQDPIVQYHAGIIALHFGRRDEARQRLQSALAANPHFHPLYADDARQKLAQLCSGDGRHSGGKRCGAFRTQGYTSP